MYGCVSRPLPAVKGLLSLVHTTQFEPNWPVAYWFVPSISEVVIHLASLDC